METTTLTAVIPTQTLYLTMQWVKFIVVVTR